MAEVQIKRFEAQYRLPAAAMAEQRRLDQVCVSALDQSFAQAVARSGVPDSAELCIRSLYVPVHLRLGGTDYALLESWSNALSTEIERAIREHSTNNTVFYHSRRQALVDMAISVARGDLRRAWAWRQLGLWKASTATSERQAIRELIRCLCNEPQMVTAMLRTIAETGHLQRIANELSEVEWDDLAFAALSAAGHVRVPEISTARDAAIVNSPRILNDSMRVLKSSTLVRAVSTSWLSRVTATVQRAFAVLVLLDAEPMLLRSATAAAVLTKVAEAFNSRGQDKTTVRTHLSDARPGTEEFDSKLAKSELNNKESATANNQVIDLRRRQLTRFGGLLFLLGVIDEQDLPEEILSHPVLGKRSFVWVMSQLALRLGPLEPFDPAVLAFAGLAPQSPSPITDQEAPNESEAAALQALVEQICEQLVVLLETSSSGEADHKAMTAASALQFVVRRRAEVIADPGWIELRFSLDEVSTEIRRAGLDLDPGYVTWLGVVVKFVYE